MKNYLAQIIKIPDVNGTPVEIRGPIPTDSPGHYRFGSLGDIINMAISYLFPLAGIILFIFIVLGGFELLTSAGDPKKVESARNKITYAVIGFVLLIVAYWLTKIVNQILSPNQPFF